MVVAALIAALVTGVAFFLRTAGLSGAANFTQLLAPISLVPPAVNWARSKKSGEQHRSSEGQAPGPGQGAATFSPNPEIPDPAETPRPRSGTSAEETFIPYVHMAPAETGGRHGALARKPRARGRWLAWFAPVLAVVALIAVEAGLQAGNGGGSAYTIPEVDNLPVGKAVALIKAKKLVPRAVGFPCLTQFMQAGLVMESLPPSGEDISEGATVELYVCTGMGLPVPQVADLPLSNAIQQLGEYGFRYTIHYAPAVAAAGIPTGVVWKQNPQAQSTYTFGGAVTLWVEPQETNSSTGSSP